MKLFSKDVSFARKTNLLLQNIIFSHKRHAHEYGKVFHRKSKDYHKYVRQILRVLPCSIWQCLLLLPRHWHLRFVSYFGLLCTWCNLKYWFLLWASYAALMQGIKWGSGEMGKVKLQYISIYQSSSSCSIYHPGVYTPLCCQWFITVFQGSEFIRLPRDRWFMDCVLW